jgi:hypothetical protein
MSTFEEPVFKGKIIFERGFYNKYNLLFKYLSKFKGKLNFEGST